MCWMGRSRGWADESPSHAAPRRTASPPPSTLRRSAPLAAPSPPPRPPPPQGPVCGGGRRGRGRRAEGVLPAAGVGDKRYMRHMQYTRLGLVRQGTRPRSPPSTHASCRAAGPPFAQARQIKHATPPRPPPLIRGAAPCARCGRRSTPSLGCSRTTTRRASTGSAPAGSTWTWSLNSLESSLVRGGWALPV